MKRIIPAALIALALGCFSAAAQQQQPVAIIGGAAGGTGVNNGASTITLGGNLVTGGALNFANIGTANQLLYATSAGNVGGLATANSGVLVTSGAGVPSISSTLPSGIAATNIVLTTPNLGTPSALVLTNATALPVGQATSQIPVTWGDSQNSQVGGATGFYCGAMGGALFAGFGNCVAPWPLTGHFKTLYAQLGTAPAGVQTVVFTLVIGTYNSPSDTALTCTVTGAAQTCNLTGQNVAITVGQFVACKAVFSATAATSTVGCSLEFDTP